MLLRVLIIEDSEDDALLIKHQLQSGGYDINATRIETAAAMQEALTKREWDLIIADHAMPHFSAIKALEMLKTSRLDLPFIIVSGNIGEELAVEAMRAGAQDYVNKDNLKRLLPVVQRELRESEERRGRKQAETSLQIERKKLRNIFETMENGVALISQNCKIEYLNPKAEQDFGPMANLECQQYFQRAPDFCKICKDPQTFKTNSFRYEWQRPESDRIYEVFSIPLLNEDETVSKLHIFTDITERKQTDARLQISLQQLRRSMEGSIEAMSRTIEIKDPYTAGHQKRVSQLSEAIAQELKLSEDLINGLRLAANIHDLGKISLPSEILSKPGKLNDIEYSMIKAHPQIGFEILRTIEFPWPIAEIVHQHHERMNGSGYPQGLTAEKILLESKILGVADVVEAMASFRPYRPALGIPSALEEIIENRGILYDSKAVDACVKIFKEHRLKLD